MLDLEAIIQQIDKLQEENRGPESETLMKESIVQAVQEEDDNALLTLLNELIGYYRETSQAEVSYQLADQARALLGRMGLEGTIPYATTLLNIANAYRAGGRLRDSMDCYRETMELYRKLLPPKDMLVASLHNNISLLYQEMGDFIQAKEHLLEALAIVEENQKEGGQDFSFELAVTYANLASTCLKLEEDEEAAEDFRKSIAIFEAKGMEEAHYSAALSSLAAYLYKKGNYREAAANYRKAMECVRRSLGENEHYRRLQESLKVCEEAMESPSGLALCREYFETYGRPMLREKFPEQEAMIAAGLVGEGSDCFGLDDAVSRDHDWGPDFCLWVTEEVWQQIGPELQEAYEQLLKEFKGYTRTVSGQGRGRRGVQTINGFYDRLLGEPLSGTWEEIGRSVSGESVSGESLSAGSMQRPVNWQQVSDASLAASVNGEVFYDGPGIFGGVRSLLSQGYPEDIQYLKLAEGAAGFAQSGQYNYGRMLGRGDRVTAGILLAEAQKCAMKLCYYMENRYPLHDKWLYKGLEKLADCEEVSSLLKELADAPVVPEKSDALGISESGALSGKVREAREKKASVLEKLGRVLAGKLYAKGFISDTESYLDAHTEELLQKAGLLRKTDKELVEEIARLEFATFDKVRNVGGRADCQNDWYTFNIMRQSQYLTWNRQMLLQYLYDFYREVSRGHNLITEKYGRMMESTAPEEYEALKKHFSELSQEKKAIVEAIVGLQVGWMEEFEAHYPTLAGNARSVHTSDDNLYNTSYETYLRGEISTYSDKMLELYGRYVVDCARRGGNLAYEIMGNSVKMYGYKTLEEAEEQMRKLAVK